MVTIQGVDVSSYQPTIDWVAVAQAGYAFAMVKASEGVDYDNPYHEAQWSGAKSVGMGRGAYHFARPSLNSAADEAAWFLKAVGALSVGDVLALDFEDPNAAGDLSGWALEWLQTVEKALGFRPLLYTNPSYLAAHNLGGNAQLAQYGLWYADWLSTEPPPPAAWPVIAIWQHADNGQVPGIPNSVDLDTFAGSIEQFRLYGLPAAPVKTPTNDDLVQCVRYLMAQPPDMAGLAAYIQPFTGGGS